MKIRSCAILLGMSMLILPGCASTVQEKGASFTFNKEARIIPNQSKKADVINLYGTPTETQILGKYQVLRYFYARESMKHGRAIGQGLLSAVTMGASDLVVDHGVTQSDMQVEGKEIEAYIDLQSGIVKDFYYHDSDNNGHDESESIYLQASALKRKGGKNNEVLALYEKAISLNDKNHRALNAYAWTLIDDSIDVQKGVILAQKAVDVFPDRPYNNGTLGIGYYKLGDFNNAEKYLQIAVSLFPVYAKKDAKSLELDTAMLKLARNQKTP